ncbi:hypothetical protein BDA99DRAFT_537698 [Phascolomyces articulosus]|uniref:Uncharacterized protein n=1 Tax=Phascolomyces articulosus TaxID=60185 RepID=A0AAD5JZU4_9FUNG|nr:hypothetical protein BDA99DRAFT_537698 [Phascolomyces articulosus]
MVTAPSSSAGTPSTTATATTAAITTATTTAIASSSNSAFPSTAPFFRLSPAASHQDHIDLLNSSRDLLNVAFPTTSIPASPSSSPSSSASSSPRLSGKRLPSDDHPSVGGKFPRLPGETPEQHKARVEARMRELERVWREANEDEDDDDDDDDDDDEEEEEEEIAAAVPISERAIAPLGRRFRRARAAASTSVAVPSSLPSSALVSSVPVSPAVAAIPTAQQFVAADDEDDNDNEDDDDNDNDDDEEEIVAPVPISERVIAPLGRRFRRARAAASTSVAVPSPLPSSALVSSVPVSPAVAADDEDDNDNEDDDDDDNDDDEEEIVAPVPISERVIAPLGRRFRRARAAASTSVVVPPSLSSPALFSSVPAPPAVAATPTPQQVVAADEGDNDDNEEDDNDDDTEEADEDEEAGEEEDEAGEEDEDEYMDVDWEFGDPEWMEVDWCEGDMDIDILSPLATNTPTYLAQSFVFVGVIVGVNYFFERSSWLPLSSFAFLADRFTTRFGQTSNGVPAWRTVGVGGIGSVAKSDGDEGALCFGFLESDWAYGAIGSNPMGTYKAILENMKHPFQESSISCGSCRTRHYCFLKWILSLSPRVGNNCIGARSSYHIRDPVYHTIPLLFCSIQSPGPLRFTSLQKVKVRRPGFFIRLQYGYHCHYLSLPLFSYLCCRFNVTNGVRMLGALTVACYATRLSWLLAGEGVCNNSVVLVVVATLAVSRLSTFGFIIIVGLWVPPSV